MEVLKIFIVAFFIFCVFLTPGLIRRRNAQRKYLKILNEYKSDYEKRSVKKECKVYSFEEYKKREELVSNDIIKYSNTHYLVWSESGQEYTKIPNNLIDEFINKDKKDE